MLRPRWRRSTYRFPYEVNSRHANWLEGDGAWALVTGQAEVDICRTDRRLMGVLMKTLAEVGIGVGVEVGKSVRKRDLSGRFPLTASACPGNTNRTPPAGREM